MSQLTFNDKQTKMMLAMIESIALKGPLPCDWDFVAEKAGYGNAGSARAQWQKVKDKMKQAADGAQPSSPATPKKRKAAGMDDDGGIGGNSKSLGGEKKAKGVLPERQESEDVPVTPKSEPDES